MAFNYSPKIVTDGLVFAVDAANKKSYPGSGTTWTDLAGSNDGTLTNGPTFNSGDGGSIVFDGTDDLVDFGNILNLGTNDLTINQWLQIDSISGTYGMSWSKSYAATGNYRLAVGFNSNRTPLIFMRGTSVLVFESSTTVLSQNTWANVTWVFDRSGNANIYLNGTNLELNADISSMENLNFQSNHPFRVGSYTDSNNTGVLLPFSGKISTTMVYFKALTATEITQNYNALKSRFGL